MKQVSTFILLFLLLNNTVFSQRSNSYTIKDTIIEGVTVSIFSNKEIEIKFKGSIEVVNNSYDKDKGYFYKSDEIIRFNEGKIPHPESQHLIEPILIIIDDIDDIDTFSVLESDSVFNKSYYDSIYNIAFKKYNSDSVIRVRSNYKINTNYSSLRNFFSTIQYLSAIYILPNITIKELLKEIEIYAERNQPTKLYGEIEEVIIGNHKVLKWLLRNGKTRIHHYVVFGKKHNYLFASSPYGNYNLLEIAIENFRFK